MLKALKFNTLIFFLLTIAGTLTHETGHYVAASELGYMPKLHYAYVTYLPDGLPEPLLTGPATKDISDAVYILAAGPLVTILIGTFGFIAIYRRPDKGSRHPFFLYCCLFWLRFPFNLAMPVVKGLMTRSGGYFGGDEADISIAFGWPAGVLPVILGITGGLICYYAFLKLIPDSSRKTFLLSGFTGALLGYLVWYGFYGPMVLP